MENYESQLLEIDNERKIIYQEMMYEIKAAGDDILRLLGDHLESIGQQLELEVKFHLTIYTLKDINSIDNN